MSAEGGEGEAGAVLEGKKEKEQGLEQLSQNVEGEKGAGKEGFVLQLLLPIQELRISCCFTPDINQLSGN